MGVDENLRRALMEGSQEFKRLKRLGEVGETDENAASGAAGAASANTMEAGTSHHTAQNNSNSSKKQKLAEMKEYTQSYVHQERRTMEKHWMDMWKDVSREISRLRREMKDETDVDVMEDLEADICALKKKKAEFARMLGMGVTVRLGTPNYLFVVWTCATNKISAIIVYPL
jgi:gas vesicle protein